MDKKESLRANTTKYGQDKQMKIQWSRANSWVWVRFIFVQDKAKITKEWSQTPTREGMDTVS